MRERLESDRLSDNTQVRYYVVRAMSKLEFRTAIRDASGTRVERCYLVIDFRPVPS